jgi:DNA-binding FrmR family transcriptional regulator
MSADLGHVAREKTKLLNRLKRIKGQVEALERSVEADKECTRILQQATACRGALNGFIAEVIEDHIREHMVDPAASKDDPRTQAAEDLVEIIHAYLT